MQNSLFILIVSVLLISCSDKQVRQIEKEINNNSELERKKDKAFEDLESSVKKLQENNY